jgi:hypothetical protein
MGIAIWMEFEMSQDQYDKVVALLGLDTKPAVGLNFHVSSFTRDGAHVFDIWNSQEDFERFQRDRLKPAVEAVGIKSSPRVQSHPVYNIYAPNVEMLRREGASSMPSARTTA